jgi:hypothetical protein
MMALGYGLPAAGGVALAERDLGTNRKVICLVGDGAGVGRMALYRRWPNKGCDCDRCFRCQGRSQHSFILGGNYLEAIRLQMRAMAKAFRAEDGVLMRALLGAAQLDSELAIALRDRWTMPRRQMAIAYFRDGIKRGYLRSDTGPDAIIALLYAPIYYRLQMGTGPLSKPLPSMRSSIMR